MLLSGSQDGMMKYFDIRMKAAATTFVRYSLINFFLFFFSCIHLSMLFLFSNAESVRDVQFNPHQYFGFAAVSENGTVQVKYLKKFQILEYVIFSKVLVNL